MSTLKGPLHVDGRLSSDEMGIPDASVRDATVDPADPLFIDKYVHNPRPFYSDDHNTLAASFQKIVHVAQADGRIAEVKAGISQAAVGGATVVIDCLVNGATVASLTITIDNTFVPYATINMGIATEAYVAGDVIQFKGTATVGGGTLPKGLFVIGLLEEQPY